MSDNEIIKALECCFRNKSCQGCPLDTNNMDSTCLKIIKKEAIQLCLRQKAEIERLKAEIEETNEADREAELQALKESKENAKLFCEAINHAKSEAIKEFAERLKEETEQNTFDNGYVYSGTLDIIIDNLVKEMTEGSK